MVETMGIDDAAVTVVEVGPRDGLQNESVVLPVETRVEMIRRLVDAGARRIEVASFVHPGRVPQMAGAEEVVAALEPREDVSYIGLALNPRGVERALSTAIDELNVNVMATDTFNERNQGVPTAGTLAWLPDAVAAAHARSVPVTLTIGASFGCPYEGEVPVERVVEVAGAGAKAGVDEIALGDTIGVAVPTDVHRRVRAVRDAVGPLPIRCHFHDTRNTGIANAYAALEEGVAALDASVGGIGGCPFAPAATGNIATEDLVYMLERMGLQTGFSLDALIEVARWVGAQLGHEVAGMLSKAGPFPPRRAADDATS